MVLPTHHFRQLLDGLISCCYSFESTHFVLEGRNLLSRFFAHVVDFCSLNSVCRLLVTNYDL